MTNQIARLKSSSDTPSYPLPWYSGGGLGWGVEYHVVRISAEQNQIRNSKFECPKRRMVGKCVRVV
jgi:hypothetical protein